MEKVPGNETQNSFHEALDETNVIAENTDFELPAPRVVGKSMYKSNVGSATDVESNNWVNAFCHAVDSLFQDLIFRFLNNEKQALSLFLLLSKN